MLCLFILINTFSHTFFKISITWPDWLKCETDLSRSWAFYPRCFVTPAVFLLSGAATWTSLACCRFQGDVCIVFISACLRESSLIIECCGLAMQCVDACRLTWPSVVEDLWEQHELCFCSSRSAFESFLFLLTGPVWWFSPRMLLVTGRLVGSPWCFHSTAATDCVSCLSFLCSYSQMPFSSCTTSVASAAARPWSPFLVRRSPDRPLLSAPTTLSTASRSTWSSVTEHWTFISLNLSSQCKALTSAQQRSSIKLNRLQLPQVH